MRLIVGCHACQRRYNASDRPIGTRFRCRCGEILIVAEPVGHTARGIRCASCGAARKQGRMSCEHCGDDFTLHERDLHTVCPDCLTRVSDRANYCHNCATPLSVGETAGEQTSRLCPACASDTCLHSRKLGFQKISVLECDGCAGLWLGNECFEHLTRELEQLPPTVAKRKKRRSTTQISVPPQRAGYRPCPVCGELMNRSNYGLQTDNRGSGTIVDYCRDHGIWFEVNELSNILAWLRDGTPAVLNKTPVPQHSEPTTADDFRQARQVATDFSVAMPNIAHSLRTMLERLFDVGTP